MSVGLFLTFFLIEQLFFVMLLAVLEIFLKKSFVFDEFVLFLLLVPLLQLLLPPLLLALQRPSPLAIESLAWIALFPLCSFSLVSLSMSLEAWREVPFLM